MWMRILDFCDRRLARWRHDLFRWRLLRLPNVTIASDSDIDPSVMLESRRGGIYQGGTVQIGAKSCIMEGVILAPWMNGRIAIGERGFVGPYTVIYGEGGVAIGDDCMIAGHCFIVASNHQTGRTDLPVASLPATAEGIKIGRNVWLGAGVIVLDGVNIGDNSVIGAGAVVTRSVPERSMAVGNPARVIRAWESGTVNPLLIAQEPCKAE